MGWIRYIACMGQKSSAHEVLLRKPEDIIEKTYM